LQRLEGRAFVRSFLMAGIIEEGEGPDPGTAAGLDVGIVKLPGSATEVEPELLADRLRFMGIAEDLVVEFEDRCRSGMEPALQWLEVMLDDLDEPTGWSCDCGALLVDGNWRGRAVMRCSECGARWALEVTTAEEGSQRLLSPPHTQWLEQHGQQEDPAYGDHPPEQVLLHGLPPLRDSIEPGESWPLAAWVDGRHGSLRAASVAC
jgi:hypothetical protein